MNIPEIVAGAVLGFLLPHIVQFARYLAYDRWRKHRLEGVWHTYHFTKENEATVLRYETWTVKKDLLGTLVTKTVDPKRPELKYRGSITAEGGYVLFDFRAIRHNERTQIRFWETIPGTEQIMYGFYLGLDFQSKPMCTIWMATRSKKSDEVARDLLRTHSSFDETERALRMPS